MPVLMILHIAGDPEKLKQSYEERFKHLDERPMPSKVLHHMVCFDDEGMHVYDVWESEEAMNANFADPSNQAMNEKIGNKGFADREVTVKMIHNVLPPLGTAPAWDSLSARPS